MKSVPHTIASKLAGAAALIAERGLDQTKMDDLAEASGVPRATLYYYFSGKEDILAFLLKDVLSQMADAVAIALERDGTAWDRLMAVVDAQLSVIADQRAVCTALLSDLGRAGRMPEIANAVVQAFYAPVQQLLVDGAEDGSLRPVGDPLAAATVIFNAVSGSTISYLVMGQSIPTQTLAREIKTLLARGLRDIE
jgi:AcrR family transcriptional regulator